MLVVWSDGASELKLPQAPLARYDLLGRALPPCDKTLPLLRAPQFVVLPEHSRPELIPPPKPASELAGKPGTIVFQALMPEDCIDLKRSGYKLKPGQTNSIPVYAYNFGTKEARGKLHITTPEKWNDDLPKDLTLEPGERKEIILHLGAPSGWEMAARVNIKGDFGEAGNSILAMRFFAP